MAYRYTRRRILTGLSFAGVAPLVAVPQALAADPPPRKPAEQCGRFRETDSSGCRGMSPAAAPPGGQLGDCVGLVSGVADKNHPRSPRAGRRQAVPDLLSRRLRDHERDHVAQTASITLRLKKYDV